MVPDLRELDGGYIVIQDAHIIGQGVADDQTQGIQRRGDQQPVGPVELLAQTEETGVDAQGNEDEGEDQQDPFRDLSNCQWPRKQTGITPS